MPLRRIRFLPGINLQATPTLNEGGWSDCNLIRWRNSFNVQQLWVPEKIAGWQHLNNSPFVGVCRGLHAWEDLSGNGYAAIGTNSRLQVLNAGVITDITPIRATTNPAPAFSTVNNSTTVTVADTAHGASTGDWVNIVVPVSIGGIILFGFYLVTVTDPNHYTITAASPATSTAGPGGAVPSFAVVNLNTGATVTLANHGLSIGSLFNVLVSTTVGGITFLGQYLVLTVPTANTFTIGTAAAATSTTSGSENGGNVQLQYLLPSGLVSEGGVSGYGTGGYGLGGYGLGAGSSVPSPLRQWFLDNWGQQLVGNPTNGTLYGWTPPTGSGSVATPLANAPLFMTASFIAMPSRILVSLGAESGGTQDPNLIRWSDVDNNTVWTATSTNQAGSYRIPTGSKIVGGKQFPQQALIWTDVDLWSMYYQQLPFVFGFNKISSGCGLIAARAIAVLGSAVVWMGMRRFFILTGAGVQELPCSVWDFIFDNLNLAQVDKITAAPNSERGEIAFHFPSASGTGEIDSYVKVQIESGLWDKGSSTLYTRTAWEDDNVLGPPIGADLNGYLQQHEVANDADGQPIPWFAKTSYVDMDDGEFFTAFDEMIPDAVTTNTASYNITVFSVNQPNDTKVRQYGPYPCTPRTKKINPKGRGRQIAFQFDGNDFGSSWRFGGMRYNGKRDGRR